MPVARHDLGLARTLHASAVGEPGSRYFRVLVEAIRGTACLWLEKEQLLQLALATQELLALSSSEESIPQEEHTEGEQADEQQWVPGVLPGRDTEHGQH